MKAFRGDTAPRFLLRVALGQRVLELDQKTGLAGCGIGVADDRVGIVLYAEAGIVNLVAFETSPGIGIFECIRAPEQEPSAAGPDGSVGWKTVICVSEASAKAVAPAPEPHELRNWASRWNLVTDWVTDLTPETGSRG